MTKSADFYDEEEGGKRQSENATNDEVEVERSGQEAESVNKLKSMLQELERCEAEIADCFAIDETNTKDNYHI